MKYAIGQKVKISFNLSRFEGEVVGFLEPDQYVIKHYDAPVRLYDNDHKSMETTLHYSVWPDYCVKAVLQPITVKLTNEYSAEVTASHIKVGCQTISWDAFDEIAKARQKLS